MPIDINSLQARPADGRLDQTVELARKIFGKDDSLTSPKRLIPASLHPDDNDFKSLLVQLKVAELHYAIACISDEMIALCGFLDRTVPEEAGEKWLLHFGVIPEAGIVAEEWFLDSMVRRARVHGAKKVVKFGLPHPEKHERTKMLFTSGGFKEYVPTIEHNSHTLYLRLDF